MSDIIEGKRALGPPQDTREVKNAYEAYERVSGLDPYSVKNLLLAHRIMMEGLVKEAGRFRRNEKKIKLRLKPNVTCCIV